MTELTEITHLGWMCRNVSCRAEFHYTPTGDLEADRADSRAKAQAKGWLFRAEAPYPRAKPDPGANLSLHYCPACAPIARARAALREAQARR